MVGSIPQRIISEIGLVYVIILGHFLYQIENFLEIHATTPAMINDTTYEAFEHLI